MAAICFLADKISTIENRAASDIHKQCCSAEDERQARTKEGDTIFQERLRKIKQMVPVTTATILSFLHVQLCKMFAGWLLVSPTKSCSTRPQSTEQGTSNQKWHETSYFRIQGEDHCYLSLTVRAYREVSCDRIRSVSDRYVLHAPTVGGTFIPFSFFSLLATIYDSNEKRGTANCICRKLNRSMTPGPGTEKHWRNSDSLEMLRIWLA